MGRLDSHAELGQALRAPGGGRILVALGRRGNGNRADPAGRSFQKMRRVPLRAWVEGGEPIEEARRLVQKKLGEFALQRGVLEGLRLKKGEIDRIRLGLGRAHAVAIRRRLARSRT